jgi:hypothetical protein
MISVMPSGAKYHRDYRQTQKDQIAAERSKAILEGVQMAARFMRRVVAGKAITGYQAATAIENAMIATDTAEAQQRRAMVEGMR